MAFTPGFLLLGAFLFYMDTGGLLAWTAAACALHELGHYLAVRALGGRVVRLRLSCVGAEMVLSARFPLTPGGTIGAALAGPAVNLALAAAAARMGEGLYLFAGLNLALGLFNLLPAAQLDGGRALGGLLALAAGPEAAGRWMGRCSGAVAAGLTLASGALAAAGQVNPSLLLVAAWLLGGALPRPGPARRTPTPP